jgi:hypothetical protein
MNDKLKQNLALIGTFLGVVIVVWGAYAYLNRYALCADLKETQMIVQMQYKALQKENDFRFQGLKVEQTNRDLIQWQNECKKNPSNTMACNEAKRLEAVKKVDEKKLEQLGGENK